MKDQFEFEVLPSFAANTLKDMRDTFADAFAQGQILGNMKNAGKLTLGAAGAGIGAGTVGVLGAGKGIEAVLGAFVNAINPAYMEQFSLVLKDMTAVIGETLVPVVKILTPLFRMWADFLASVLPNQREIELLLEAFTPVLGLLNDTLATIAPYLKDVFAVALSYVGEILKQIIPIMVGFMQTMLKVWAEAINMLNMIGLGGNMALAQQLNNIANMELGELGKMKFGKTSVGKAAGGAITSNFEGLQSRIALGAFGLGKKEPIVEVAEKQLAVQERIAAAMAAGPAAQAIINAQRNALPGGGNK